MISLDFGGDPGYVLDQKLLNGTFLYRLQWDFSHSAVYGLCSCYIRTQFITCVQFTCFLCYIHWV